MCVRLSECLSMQKRLGQQLSTFAGKLKRLQWVRGPPLYDRARFSRVREGEGGKLSA